MFSHTLREHFPTNWRKHFLKLLQFSALFIISRHGTDERVLKNPRSLYLKPEPLTGNREFLRSMENLQMGIWNVSWQQIPKSRRKVQNRAILECNLEQNRCKVYKRTVLIGGTFNHQQFRYISREWKVIGSTYAKRDRLKKYLVTIDQKLNF